MRMLLGFIVALAAAASPARAATDPVEAVGCTCGPRPCAIVDGVHVASALRPVVRRLFRSSGLVPVAEHQDDLFDAYTAPAGAPYTHVFAAYHERRLWELRYRYMDRAALASVLEWLGTQYGAPVESSGKLRDGEDSARTWHAPQGVEVVLTRGADHRGFMLTFKVPSVRKDLDDYLAGKRRTNAAPPTPKSEVEGLAISPRQGRLDVRADAPVLHGGRELKLDICGEHEDFDTFEHVEPGDTARFVTFHPGDVVDVKLGIHDGRDDLVYAFAGLAPGTPSRAAALGDCTSRVTATYRPTRSPLCVHAVQKNQPTGAVVERLVAATGITVDGADLLPNSRVTFDFDITAADLLRLIADADDIRLERIDDTHYAFRR